MKVWGRHTFGGRFVSHSGLSILHLCGSSSHSDRRSLVVSPRSFFVSICCDVSVWFTLLPSRLVHAITTDNLRAGLVDVCIFMADGERSEWRRVASGDSVADAGRNDRASILDGCSRQSGR